MTNKNYFSDVRTMEDLKQEYRKLAKKFHPDLNREKDTTTIMQAVNNQYEKLFEELKHSDKNTINEDVSTFRDIINNLVKYDNITIDVVGSWLWVYGAGSFHIKDDLKGYGFRWSRNRKKWYFFDNIQETRKRRVKKNIQYNDIINRYGLDRTTTKNNSKPLLSN